MCFSASASFIAGGAIGGVGMAALSKVRSKAELPLASIPFLFGLQQITEGVVWLSFESPILNIVATYVYSLFSHILWPFFVPFAVFLVEENIRRKKILLLILALGAVVSAYLLFFIVKNPVTSEIAGGSIAYISHHHYPVLTMMMYLVAVCGSCLLSSHKIIKLFGGILTLSFVVAYQLYIITFFSVWCFFGAVLSLILYFHFSRRK